MKCSYCQTKNGGNKGLKQHKADKDYLCKNCLKKIDALNEILGEFYK